MLKAHLIETSNTKWTSPVIFAPKKYCSRRFCNDYCRLNYLMFSDSYLIPRMDECIDSLGDVNIFSTIDCNSGYWKIPAAESDRDITAFFIHQGQYRFKRMTFSLKNSPGICQHAIHIILSSVRSLYDLEYLADTIIFSTNIRNQLRHLTQLLQPLSHKASQ